MTLPMRLLPFLLALCFAASAAGAPYRTVVVFGDTQRLVLAGEQDPSEPYQRFRAMLRWVVAHRESENIDFVLHVGDVIDSGGVCRPDCDPDTVRRVNGEWRRFAEAWSALDRAGIPYAIVPGNHDNVLPQPADDDRPALLGFASFFGRERFQHTPGHVATCDGATPDDRCHGARTLGHLWRFRLGPHEVLVAGLPDRPEADVQAWFEDTILAQPELPVVLLSHQWLRPFDLLWFRYLSPGRSGNPGPLTERTFMTAMGHFTQDRQRIVEIGDDRVLAVEFDRQAITGSGDAAIALLRFYLGSDGDPEPLDGVDALRVEPDIGIVRTGFPGRTPFSIDDDLDRDGVDDAVDGCPRTWDPGQHDLDGDGLGDACDPDRDGDGVPDESDVCPQQADPEQADADGDGSGDLCDADLDDDGDVDRRDLRVLRRCARRDGAWGRAPGWRHARHAEACAESDLDGSGRVDRADVAALLRACGEACARRR